MLTSISKANKTYWEVTAILKMQQVAYKTMVQAVFQQQDTYARRLTGLPLLKQLIVWQMITKHVSKIMDFSAITQINLHGAI